MFDPLTAFAAAGNALQFAQLAAQVVKKTIEYADSGASTEHERLHHLTQQLTVSNAHLHATLMENSASVRPPGPARALHFANEECLKVCNDMSYVLKGLRLNKSQSLWRSVRIALKAIRCQSSIESISSRIDRARNNLVLSLLIYLHSSTSSSAEKLHADQQRAIVEAHKTAMGISGIQIDVAQLNSKFSDLELREKVYFDKIAQENKHLAIMKDAESKSKASPRESTTHNVDHPNILRSSPTGVARTSAASATPENLTGEQRALTPQELPQLGQNGQILPEANDDSVDEHVDPNEQIKARIYFAGLKHDTELQAISQELMRAITRLNDVFNTSLTEFGDLSHVMEKEVLKRYRTLASLSFSKMNDRRNRIARAHNDTFKWILREKTKGDRTVIWDDFCHWLNSEDANGVYWIFGKPGCGKSTMIRELEATIASQSVADQWIADKDLVIASCYFWSAGTSDQKSFQGFLQSLLYQLLQQRPDLVDIALPANWGEKLLSLPSSHWEEHELKYAVQKVLHESREDSKVLIFVDGLDEIDGDDELRVHFLNFLVSLASESHVKACVASRPWYIFRDKFSSCPQLRLEDLITDDINAYVRGNLGADKAFQTIQKKWNREHQTETLLDRIADEITDKARGVFLWVRLVVRDLLKIVRDGAKAANVFQELKNMPPDLDDYFRRMMNTIDPSYRKEASMMLQSALCNMEYPGSNFGNLCSSGSELLLLHLDYLEDDVDPHFAVALQPFVTERDQAERELEELMEVLNRRLASRCMGLLEVDTPFKWACEVETHPWTTRIEFLHRTVRDFLSTNSIQALLREYSGSDFDAHLFRCNTLVANVCIPGGVNESEFRLFSFLCFFNQIQNRPENEHSATLLRTKMMSLLDEQVHELRPEIDALGHVYTPHDTWLFEYIQNHTSAHEISDSYEQTSSTQPITSSEEHQDIHEIQWDRVEVTTPPIFFDEEPQPISNPLLTHESGLEEDDFDPSELLFSHERSDRDSDSGTKRRNSVCPSMIGSPFKKIRLNET